MGVFTGVILLRNNQVFRIGASPTITPKDVRVSNLSDTSATISWITEDATVSFVTYGTSTNVGTIAYESEDGQKYNSHSITITGLKPESVYYFKINSNGTNFDNNGVAWQFSTGKALSTNQTSVPISGSLITASGQTSKRAIVYVIINGYTVSTLTSDNGTFILQLGFARTPDLSSYALIDPTKTLLEISATTDMGELSTAKIFPQSANPIPTLIVGQDQDFRNLAPTLDGFNPNADINLPEAATAESKFDVSGSKVQTSDAVTLKSVDEGEVVTSDKPQFFGNGPTGEKITITVHSDTEVSGTTTVTAGGSWNWSPPTNLSEGAHSVTISWIDALGITRTLTRNFVVQAGELPSFVASGSATPTVTPKVTNTPSPTVTPKVTTTITPSATPIKTASATPVALPKSGSLTPTILMLMMSIVVITFSFYVWKESKN